MAVQTKKPEVKKPIIMKAMPKRNAPPRKSVRSATVDKTAALAVGKLLMTVHRETFRKLAD